MSFSALKSIFYKLVLVLYFHSGNPASAESTLDGSYKSEFMMRMNMVVYQGNYKCPREVPIKIILRVVGDQLSGSIENTHKQCNNWQNASISGSIDDEGNFLKTKFIHKDKIYGRREDAYKIEGNILSEMTLKSKSRQFWKDKQFKATKFNEFGL